MSYSLFVSSTSDDLGDIREKVSEEAHNRGLRTNTMVSMIPNTETPLEFSLRGVREADCYIGLLGSTYGSVPDDKKVNPLDLSYTELEFREAKRRGKRIAWFLHTDGQASGSDPEAAAATPLGRLWREIENDYCRRYFSSWEELQPLVAKQLDAWEHLRRLEFELDRRYGGGVNGARQFTVVPGRTDGRDVDVFRTAARALVSAIRRGVRDLHVHTEDRFRVGIAGGRAHSRIVEELESDPSLIDGDDYARVTFVALNSAALSKHFNFTANYLVTRLSSLFHHAEHKACLGGAGRSRDAFDYSVARLDLVLAGAGARDGFLRDWFEDRGGIPMPETMVGDFCYVPIDQNGAAIDMTSAPDAFAKAFAELDVHPRFADLAGIGRAQVILPLVGQPQDTQADQLTIKGEIGDIVLSRANVHHCIIDERTAIQLLGLRLCGFMLGECLGADEASGGVLYKAKREPGDDAEVVNIIHQSDCRHILPPAREAYSPCAEILVSDPPGPFTPLSAEVFVGKRQWRFAVRDGVRRPGLWSGTMARVAAGLVSGRRGISVLDMGCGTGAVGHVLSEILWDPAAKASACDAVTFVDIDRKAVENAEENRLKVKWHAKKLYIQSDLFQKLDGTFDLALFSPPFLPDISGLKADPVTEVSAWFANTTGLKFAESVANHLRPNGYAVIALANYSGYSDVERELEIAGLSVEVQRRPVLYPRVSRLGWVPAREVANRAILETALQPAFFRDEYFRDRQLSNGRPLSIEDHYVAFEMVHVVGHKPA